MAPLLQQLLKDIDRLEAQRSGKENTLVTIAPEEKVRIEQQIDDLKEQMARKRREFWEALAERLQLTDYANNPNARNV
jgi:predicted  nucleic acid-binding Zn-ribbon protein